MFRRGLLLTCLVFGVMGNLFATTIDGTSSIQYFPDNYKFNDGDSAIGFVRFGNGFTVDNFATADLDVWAPVIGGMRLIQNSTLNLDGDLKFDGNTTWKGLGYIKGNGHKIFLGGDVTIEAEAFYTRLDCQGSLIIDGLGNSLSFLPKDDAPASLCSDLAVSVTLSNMTISFKNTSGLSGGFTFHNDKLVFDQAAYLSKMFISNNVEMEGVLGAGTYDFQGIGPKSRVLLSNDLTIASTSDIYWHGPLQFDGGGKSLYFGSDVNVSLDAGATLTMRNLMIYGPNSSSASASEFSGAVISVENDNSSLTFDNVTLVPGTGQIRLVGNILFNNDLVFTGNNAKIGPLYIETIAPAKIAFGSDMTLEASYLPSGCYGSTIIDGRGNGLYFELWASLGFHGDVATSSTLRNLTIYSQNDLELPDLAYGADIDAGDGGSSLTLDNITLVAGSASLVGNILFNNDLVIVGNNMKMGNMNIKTIAPAKLAFGSDLTLEASRTFRCSGPTIIDGRGHTWHCESGSTIEAYDSTSSFTLRNMKIDSHGYLESATFDHVELIMTDLYLTTNYVYNDVILSGKNARTNMATCFRSVGLNSKIVLGDDLTIDSLTLQGQMVVDGMGKNVYFKDASSLVCDVGSSVTLRNMTIYPPGDSESRVALICAETDARITLDNVTFAPGRISLFGDIVSNNNVIIAGEGADMGTFDISNSDRIKMALSNDVTMARNRIITCTGRLNIDGAGYRLYFEPGSGLLLDHGATVTLSNMTINCNSSLGINLNDDISNLTLDNVKLVLDDDIVIANGKLFIHNDVIVTGTHKFNIYSPAHLAIGLNSTMFSDSDLFLNYQDTQGNIEFVDDSSKLYLNGCAMNITGTLELIKGTMIVDQNSYINIGNLNDGNVCELLIGNDNAADDFSIKIMPAASLSVPWGRITYKNQQ